VPLASGGIERFQGTENIPLMTPRWNHHVRVTFGRGQIVNAQASHLRAGTAVQKRGVHNNAEGKDQNEKIK